MTNGDLSGQGGDTPRLSTCLFSLPFQESAQPTPFHSSTCAAAPGQALRPTYRASQLA